MGKGINLAVQQQALLDTGWIPVVERPFDKITHEIADQQFGVVTGEVHVEEKVQTPALSYQKGCTGC